MIDCLDEYSKEKYKIRPENVSTWVRKIKTDEFNNHCFFIKSQIMISKNKQKINIK